MFTALPSEFEITMVYVAVPLAETTGVDVDFTTDNPPIRVTDEVVAVVAFEALTDELFVKLPVPTGKATTSTVELYPAGNVPMVQSTLPLPPAAGALPAVGVER